MTDIKNDTNNHFGGKPCRSCTDFKTWIHIQKQNSEGSKKQNPESMDVTMTGQFEVSEQTQKVERQCPLDKEELGRNTWSLLHTMAAYYPEKPSPAEQADMNTFLRVFSNFYPCSYCAEDLRRDLEIMPPVTESRHAFSQWLCKLHNVVNEKLGKPIFDCSKVDERWLTGPSDGSCDV